MPRIIFILSALLSPVWLVAQYILQGPAIGAVTASSARMYLRAEHQRALTVEVSPADDFSASQRFSGNTRAHYDNSVIINLTGLQPDTKYFYRIFVDAHPDTMNGNFRTFPAEGAKGVFTFVTGSCQETENMKVFNAIPVHHPYFLLHTGDYTYPDYQIRPDYSADYPTVAYSYQKRYDEKVMKDMLRYIPIDYIYDDNDYVGMSGGRFVKNHNENHSKLIFKANNYFETFPFPSFWRTNCIKGYTDFFPHYELPDTSEGIYHSFKFGNAEFFFLDRCSAKPTSHAYGFRYDEKRKRWLFEPPDDHVLFGKKQMDWLKVGLKNSTADWKFIVSGVPLNKNLRKLIDAGIKFQKTGWGENNGFRMAAGFAHYWAGHPAEMNDFHDFLKKEKIENVIVISGDTHHNVMDDGKNAGLPELNASGLSVTETYLAYYLSLVGKLTGSFRLKRDIWNQGGNGIGNKNFKNAFGKVTIVNDDYVELSIVDEDNEVISSFRVKHTSKR